MLIKKDYKVLFHGDSITDAGRDRDDVYSLAPNGHPFLSAERFNAEHPELNVTFYNRAISGFRTCDLLNVLERDLEEIKPDLVCLHIGINDVWRRYDSNIYTSAEEFEQNFTAILKTIDKFGAKCVVLGLYALPAPDKTHWREEVNEKIKISGKLAKRHANAYINVDEVFETLLDLGAPWERFSDDGVHPTFQGAQILSDCFIKAVNQKEGLFK